MPVLLAAALDLFSFLQRLEHRGALRSRGLCGLWRLLRQGERGCEHETQRDNSNIHFRTSKPPAQNLVPVTPDAPASQRARSRVDARPVHHFDGPDTDRILSVE